MKTILTILVVIACHSGSQAQGGFFNQKATQKKYYLQQIAALKVYAGFLKEGYKTVHTGLNVIGGFKAGEKGLHFGYYQSLKDVSPVIQNSPVIKAIYADRQLITQTFRECYTKQGQTRQLTDQELAYIKRVWDNIEKEANKDMQELQLILSPGNLQMTDDQRLKRENEIAASIQDKKTFSYAFARKAGFVAAQRKKQKAEIETLRKLYNIK